MGVGIASGENRVEEAVKRAIESPLLETSIEGAKSILLYVAGGYDMGMLDISKIAERIQAEADPDANIIFGATVNEDMNNSVTVTLIATDFASGSGLTGDKIDASVLEATNKQKHAGDGTIGKPMKVDGLDAVEMDLSALMGDSDSSAATATSLFDVPDFLK